MKKSDASLPRTGLALITGASSGIGLHLAREFAHHGHSLVLVAPNAEETEAVAGELRKEFQVTVRVIAKDLTQPGATDEIAAELHRDDAEVECLVNNAGFGERGKFWSIAPETHLAMIRLNIEAVIRLTHHFLPPMIARGYGRILNTASIAGFEPGPDLAVYHATKAFVLSLSQALATELEESGVTVTALCPGATDTDFFPKAHLVDTRAFQRQPVMAPQEVAVTGYAALMQGDPLVVPGALNKTMVAARRLLTKSAQSKKNEKLYAPTRRAERQRNRGEVENAKPVRRR